MQQRIGIYPGTFDPVHNGHIAFAAAALDTNIVDEVIFIPEQKPRGKDAADISHRLEMIKQAIAGTPKLSAEVLEDEQFTVKNTLPKLREVRKEAKLSFLIGSDVARSLSSWNDLATLIESVSFVIGLRAGDNKNNLVTMLQELGQQYSHPISYTFIDTPSNHVASTHMRMNEKSRESLHPTTRDYIALHHLYQ